MTLTVAIEITQDRIAALVEDLVEDGLSRVKAIARAGEWLAHFLTEEQLREVMAWGAKLLGKAIEWTVARFWEALEKAISAIVKAFRRDPVKQAKRAARRAERRASRRGEG